MSRMTENIQSCAEIASIIPVKDNQAGIERLLESFFANTKPEFYPKVIIIVDNNSKNPIELPSKYSEKNSFIQCIKCQKPGAGNARNEGAQLAKTFGVNWLHFIDSDCLFTENTLSGYLIDAANAVAYQGNVKAVGQDWLSVFYDDNQILNPIPNFENGILKGPLYLVTVNTLVNVAAFEHVGGFDETFVVAAEDVDLGYRLATVGPLAYSSTSLVKHDYLSGDLIVKNKHVLELVNRFKKYGNGERPILMKYGANLKKFEQMLEQQLHHESQKIPGEVLMSLGCVAFTEGVFEHLGEADQQNDPGCK
jgi:glycosyltransferase involved in cell wall biosynthesis